MYDIEEQRKINQVCYKINDECDEWIKFHSDNFEKEVSEYKKVCEQKYRGAYFNRYMNGLGYKWDGNSWNKQCK